MPLTRREYELGIDEDTSLAMRTIYSVLEFDRELAYSFDELSREVSKPLPSAQLTLSWSLEKLVSHALVPLASIGAIEQRTVKNADYYAFAREWDTESWELKDPTYRPIN